MKMTTKLSAIIWITASLIGSLLKILHKVPVLSDILIGTGIVFFWVFLYKLIKQLRTA
jgi:hypothetical protein